MDTKTDYSLLEHNTFHLDVKTAYFIEYATFKELWEILDKFRVGELPAPWMHIGSGSNLLFTGDYPGTILHSGMKGKNIVAESTDNIWLKIGAGEKWDEIVEFCIEHGWQGLENLSFIPGEVGAAAVQNIGAYGVELKDYITFVEVVDVETGNVTTLSSRKCGYSYRQSLFKSEWKKKYIVTSVTVCLNKRPFYRLKYGDLQERMGQMPITAGRIRNVIGELRKSKLPDPAEKGNAGSFFMNPIVSRSRLKELEWAYPEIPSYPVDFETVKIPAAWLIEMAGWKGKVVGNVGVYEEQPLVLVNLGEATGMEIMEVANEICQSVKEQFKIDLRPEVNVL